MPATWEVVHIIDQNTVLDEESYQRSPQLAQGRHPGFYLIAMGALTGPDDDTIGPFPSQHDALSRLTALFPDRS